MAKKKTNILVDGPSYLFRAYYALPPLMTQAGWASGAVYSVINLLKKWQDDDSCGQIVVVFDPKGKTFRHDQDHEYKANRSRSLEDLADLIEPSCNMTQTMDLPLIVVDLFKADGVSDEGRRLAKAVNFSLMDGVSYFRLTKQLGI